MIMSKLEQLVYSLFMHLFTFSIFCFILILTYMQSDFVFFSLSLPLCVFPPLLIVCLALIGFTCLSLACSPDRTCSYFPNESFPSYTSPVCLAGSFPSVFVLPLLHQFLSQSSSNCNLFDFDTQSESRCHNKSLKSFCCHL